MNSPQKFIALLIKEGFELYKYSYTSKGVLQDTYRVTGYIWSRNGKPTDQNILGSSHSRSILSYVLKVEYTGQDLSQTLTKEG